MNSQQITSRIDLSTKFKQALWWIILTSGSQTMSGRPGKLLTISYLVLQRSSVFVCVIATCIADVL